MSQRIQAIMRRYSQRDYHALKAIYDFRCLTFEQIYELHYSVSLRDGLPTTCEYAKKKIVKFKKDGLIEEAFSYKNRVVYFLTTDGVHIVKEAFNLFENVYDERKRLHVKGYLKSSELKLANRFIEHQYHLNQFMLQVIKNYPDVPYHYEDEKRISRFVGIRPDGILSMYHTDFFLEMDMGTENAKQLEEKWANYRRFCRSNEFLFKERRIVVLFIIEGVKNVSARIRLIQRTLMNQIPDLLSLDFECYIQTPDTLLTTIKEKIIPEEKGQYQPVLKLKQLLATRYGFSIVEGAQLKTYFQETCYPYYMINRATHQDAILVPHYKENMSAFGQMTYFDTRKAAYIKRFKKNILLIIVLDEPDVFFAASKAAICFFSEHTYFTTQKDLEEASHFTEALFQFSDTGEKIYRKA